MEHTLQDFELVLRALQNVKEPHAWVGSSDLQRIDRVSRGSKDEIGFPKKGFFRRENLKLCEKKFQIFQIFGNDFSKSLIINKRKAEPEGFEPSVRF